MKAKRVASGVQVDMTLQDILDSHVFVEVDGKPVDTGTTFQMAIATLALSRWRSKFPSDPKSINKYLVVGKGGDVRVQLIAEVQ